MVFTRLLSELKRRKVTNVAVAYAVVGTAVTEGIGNVSDALGMPSLVLRTTVIIILLGFPVALVLAWFLRVSPEAREPTSPDGGSVAAPRPVEWGSVAGWAVAAVLLVVLGWRGLSGRDTTTEAFAAISQLERAMSRSEWIRAYQLAHELPDAVPDTVRQDILASVSLTKELDSDPSGARVSWRPYGEPDAEWELVGRTPLTWRAPRAGVALRFEREGHVPRTVAIGLPPYLPLLPQNPTLQPEDGLFSESVYLSGGTWSLTLSDQRLTEAPQVALDPFYIDLFEVTNEDYEAFVDAGGYSDPSYWLEPIQEDGRVLPFEEAMARFVDQDGQAGPSTWEGGTYPDRMGDHPVAGVSWYEAAAYAQFAGRELPTLYHWFMAAKPWVAEWLFPNANFAGDGTWPVGRSGEVSQEGAYDMAGNVREWVVNAMSTDDLRYTVGGGWNDERWMFSYAHPQSPLDRSPTNGFRLMRQLGSPANLAEASVPVESVIRDYTVERPVDDATFERFRALLSYDGPPLNDALVEVDTTAEWIRETIQFDPGYSGDPMLLHLMLPLAAPARPRQTVIYFPAPWIESVGDVASFLETDEYVRFLVRSGRAVAVPAREGTLERRYDTRVTYSVLNEYRDKILHQRADLGRTLDYLETRGDIDEDAFAYFAVSGGAVIAPILLAVEPRLRVAALVTVGLSMRTVQEVVDPLHFLPRVHVPVLMMNGAYDRVIDPELSARPFYELLGTDEADKELRFAPSSHTFPTPRATQETLAWLDRYLGEVR